VNENPIILLNGNKISIDYQNLIPISIFAKIFKNTAKSDPITVSFLVSNAKNYTVLNASNNTVVESETIEIVYYPSINEQPIFR
jgi:hypothetical protein